MSLGIPLGVICWFGILLLRCFSFGGASAELGTPFVCHCSGSVSTSTSSTVSGVSDSVIIHGGSVRHRFSLLLSCKGLFPFLLVHRHGLPVVAVVLLGVNGCVVFVSRGSNIMR